VNCVLKPIVAVAVCVFALMVVIKDGRVLRTAGLTGSCKVVQTLADSSEIALCRPGKLEGTPDLSHRACRTIGAAKNVEYWRCPAGFDISDFGR
jgi:hypothetical protein